MTDAYPIDCSYDEVTSLITGRCHLLCRPANCFADETAMQFDPRFDPATTLWKAATGGYECQCRYGTGSSNLWVRETWATFHPATESPDIVRGITYRAGFDVKFIPKLEPDMGCFVGGRNSPWQAGIIMPRRNSRLTLTGVRIRCRRVQDLDQYDVMATMDAIESVNGGYAAVRHCTPVYDTPLTAFKAVWDKRYGKGAYDRNGFTWFISFGRILLTT